MTLKNFIKDNKTEIAAYINNMRWVKHGRVIPTPAPIYSEDDIEDWIANDESLYNWARNEGCRV